MLSYVSRNLNFYPNVTMLRSGTFGSIANRRRKRQGVGNGGSPPQPTSITVVRSLRERRELTQLGPGRSPGRKRIPVLSMRHRMHLVEISFVN